MNWRENAHLFANGKFCVISHHGPMDGRYIIIGFVFEHEPHFWLNDGDIVPVKQCQLIARHIDDVTDEEIREWGAYNYSEEFCHDLRQTFCEDVERNLLSTVNLLYLLSIGVYPFPWPKDGSVIREG